MSVIWPKSAARTTPATRLIVCHNPLLAEHRRQKREALLTATEEALAGIARQVARRTRTPLSATEIAEKLGRVKNRFQVAKHFRTQIADGSFHYERRTEAIIREAQLDGFYMLRTSEPADRLPTAAVVRRYKDLTRVERAFRSLKTVDLHIRPIRHRVETSGPGSSVPVPAGLLRPVASAASPGPVAVR